MADQETLGKRIGYPGSDDSPAPKASPEPSWLDRMKAIVYGGASKEPAPAAEPSPSPAEEQLSPEDDDFRRKMFQGFENAK